MWTKVARQALTALEKLERAGYESYLVGGCVRDLLRGETPHDADLTTIALPEQTKAVFADQHVIETGIKHGTVTVVLDGVPLEITTFRTEGMYSDGRHPDEVQFTRTLREDLRRRDFTVNAMAMSPRAGMVDPFGGADDLQNKMIRCVGDPRERFSEDALRILRAARFASTLDFEIEEKTARAMVELTPLLAKVSAERIAAEFVKLLCGAGAQRVLTEFRELIAFIVPEIRESFGFPQQNKHHCYDVYTHTVCAVSYVPPEPVLRLAAFFHDIGKPRAYHIGENGRGSFCGHPQVGEQIARDVMHRLKFSNAIIRDVCILVREHDYLLQNEHGALRLLQRLPNDLLDPLMYLMRADALAKASPQESLKKVERLRDGLWELIRQSPALHVSDLAIDGKQLIALGVSEGKAVGTMLEYLLEQVIDGKVQNTTESLAQCVLKTVDKE